MAAKRDDHAWDVRLKDLSVGYGDAVVLSNLTAHFPAGKITVILGGSGCGKSTLLRHVIGLSKPLRGKTILAGHDLHRLKYERFRKIRRRLGVLFQDGALLGSLDLFENIALPLREHTDFKEPKIRAKVMEKLGLVGLSDFAKHHPSQLSGGMRKRAGLARALVNDPAVLFCDEPTSGLDPINAAQMDVLLRDMNARLGVTVVVVSHDLASLKTLADHVLVLNDGGGVYEGGLDDLLKTDDPFLRRFLDRRANCNETGA